MKDPAGWWGQRPAVNWSGISASRPWAGNAEGIIPRKIAEKESISLQKAKEMYEEYCSGCTYSDCKYPRCPASGRCPKKDTKRGSEYRALYNTGMTDKKIAEELHVNRKSVSSWRARQKLPPNMEEPCG